MTTGNNEKVGGSLTGWTNENKEELKHFKNFLKRADTKKAIRALPALHEKAFAKIDCLECGNCCRNYSPRFKTPDIKRIAKRLKIKEGSLIETYLKLDEEGDYVTRTSPCPFLGADNRCSIYEDRPSDCHRFPYTDEDVFIKRPRITLKNVTFCPIAYDVLKNISQ